MSPFSIFLHLSFLYSFLRSLLFSIIISPFSIHFSGPYFSPFIISQFSIHFSYLYFSPFIISLFSILHSFIHSLHSILHSSGSPFSVHSHLSFAILYSTFHSPFSTLTGFSGAIKEQGISLHLSNRPHYSLLCAPCMGKQWRQSL